MISLKMRVGLDTGIVRCMPHAAQSAVLEDLDELSAGVQSSIARRSQRGLYVVYTQFDGSRMSTSG